MQSKKGMILQMMSLRGSSDPGRAWPCPYTTSPYSCRAQLQQSDCQPGLGRTKELRFCPHLGWRETKRRTAGIGRWPKRNRLPGRMLETKKMYIQRKKQTNKKDQGARLTGGISRQWLRDAAACGSVLWIPHSLTRHPYLQQHSFLLFLKLKQVLT